MLLEALQMLDDVVRQRPQLQCLRGIPPSCRLYELLAQSVDSFVSVGHRPSLLQYHTHVLELKGGGEWQIVEAADYTPSA